MMVLIVLALALVALVVGGIATLIMRASIPKGDTQRRADFDRKTKDAMMIFGGVVAGSALAASKSDRRQSRNFARSWDLDHSQFDASRAAEQTADYNRHITAYNQQVMLNNASQPMVDPNAYNAALAREEAWWAQHGWRAY